MKNDKGGKYLWALIAEMCRPAVDVRALFLQVIKESGLLIINASFNNILTVSLILLLKIYRIIIAVTGAPMED